MRFKNKIVVVVGSGHGLGRSIAIEFAKEGAIVIVADINLFSAEETVNLIFSLQGIAIPYGVDVTQPLSILGLTNFVFNKFSRIDILVNNASIHINSNENETSFDEWNGQVSVNLGGLFLCTKYFLPYLKRSKGSIVSTSLCSYLFSNLKCTSYRTLKSATLGFTKAMATEHIMDDVRVNCICPGGIEFQNSRNNFQRDQSDIQLKDDKFVSFEVLQINKEKQLAKVVLFLASENASFITGSTIFIADRFNYIEKLS